ncbi:MAG: acetolactate decarboxylase [Massilia sp.]
MTLSKHLKLGISALCVCAATLVHAADGPALYVYSTIDALLAGAYDGDLTVKQLSAKGNFGIGTYNHLNGEMVVLDGVYYHVKADGSVTVADPAERVPLAYVLPFKPTESFSLAGVATLPAIEALADQRATNSNMFYAFEIKGRFTDISTRAISSQVRPYRPLAEVAKTQSVFKRESVTGTLVGIRSPALSKGISVPGYHWHFISDDKKFGGHVLSIGSADGVARLALVSHLDIDLPTTDDFAKADQAKDRAAELRKVEGNQH